FVTLQFAVPDLELDGRGLGGRSEDLENSVGRRAMLRIRIRLELLAAAGIIIVHFPFAARAAVVRGEVRVGVVDPEMLHVTRDRVTLALGNTAMILPGREVFGPVAADLGL